MFNDFIMKILKYNIFQSGPPLVQFVNDNNILQEDIVTITPASGDSTSIAIYFYGESDVKEKERNIWGNLKEN